MPAVLALDLGLRLGWALARPGCATEHGVRHFLSVGERLRGRNWNRVRAFLTDTKERAGGEIGELWYERGGFFRSLAAGAHHYGLVAIVQAWADHHAIPYVPISPQTIKKHATGNGAAKKPEVLAAMRARGWPVDDDNEADALALLDLALERNTLRKEAA